ncbi:MAG: Carboxyl-terminal protease [Microgenomates bacterium 39_7]|nr:MAG: Carboxyl-terminal protease [Microgenomates bacterium 39_7]
MFKLKFKTTLIIILVFIIGLGGGLYLSNHQDQIPVLNKLTDQSQEEQNRYLAFIKEVRQVILDNYWDSINEEQFTMLTVRAIEQLTAQPMGDRIKTYEELDEEILSILENYPDDEIREEFAVQLSDMILANLEPFGRSRLYSRQLEQELVEKVSNIDPEADHYQALGVDEQASDEEVAQAYQQQKEALEAEGTPEAQEKLAQVEAAHQTLADPITRERYDVAGVNPTMEWRLISPQIFYLRIKQFSPTTVQELLEVTEKVDNRDDNLDTLILDLRGNFGGAIDSLPYFLGPFIGNNQHAYQFLQQGKTTDYKTRTGWLPTLTRYKKVVVLIDDKVQSSAEVMADVIKRYNVGVLVGTTTMGWGTVERVFPLENQLSENEEYSLFLVHHLTLRTDGLPIESNGIEPMINIAQENWQQELYRYFNDQELVNTVESIVSAKN